MDKKDIFHYMGGGMLFILCFVIAVVSFLEFGDWLFGWKV